MPLHTAARSGISVGVGVGVDVLVGVSGVAVRVWVGVHVGGKVARSKGAADVLNREVGVTVGSGDGAIGVGGDPQAAQRIMIRMQIAACLTGQPSFAEFFVKNDYKRTP